MRELLVFVGLLLSAQGIPGGYFKQEYQFKKSSQTYNNNQLETKNEDEGYYGKQGDLDGRVTPQVDQHNQHSEFISPAVDGVGHSLTTYNDRDLTPEAERAFREHNLQPGSTGYHAYSSSSASRSGVPAYHGSASSIGHSNLQMIAQNLEYDMSRQISEAVKSIGQVRSNDLRYLEDQLKANVTRLMQEAIRQQYGQQYGSLSTYDSNDYTNLKNNLESNLLQKLHDQARYSQSSSSSSSSTYMSTYSGSAGTKGASSSSSSDSHRQVYRDSAEIEDLNRHGYRPSYTTSSHYPYDTQRPERIAYGSQQNTGSYGSSYSSNAQSTYGSTNYNRNLPVVPSSHVVVNPHRSVSEVVQKVQDDLSQRVRNAIKMHEEKYTANRYALTGTSPTYNVALDDLKRDLMYNLTRKLQDELDRTYGQQRISGEYSFSQNAQTNANYRITDLDDLRKQAEANLVNYLETALMQSEKNRQQMAVQHSQRDYNAHRPENSQSLTSDTAQNPNYVRYESRPYPGRTSYRSQSSWSASSSYGSGDDNYQEAESNQLDHIRAQLQQNLQRQLNAAVYGQNAHSSFNSQSINQIEQVLTDELKSNLTRQLQDSLNEHYGKQGIRGGQSYTISSGVYNSKANYRQEDLNRLQQQLQEELVRNLREQLKQQQQRSGSGASYGRREEYSAMSSSSSSSAGGYQGPRRFNGTTLDTEGQTNDNTANDSNLDSFGNTTKPIRGDLGADIDKDEVTEKTTRPQNVDREENNQGQQIEEILPFEEGQIHQPESGYPTFLDFGQQPVDYDDDFLLGVQPLNKRTTEATTSRTLSDSYRNRPQVYIHQPTTKMYHATATTTDPTDHKVSTEEETLGQRLVDDDYFQMYHEPSETSTSPPARSLADVHRSFISQPQYGNRQMHSIERKPMGNRGFPSQQRDFDDIGQHEDVGDIEQRTETIEGPHFTRFPIQRFKPEREDNYSDYHPLNRGYHGGRPSIDRQQEQQEIIPPSPPIYVSSSHPRTRMLNGIASPNTSNADPQQKIDGMENRGVNIGQEDIDRFLTIEEEVAVTEIVPKLGFWERISKGIKDAKQKVKQKVKDFIDD